jgi:CO/xanthine dehydrogenase FAD-binding subunit
VGDYVRPAELDGALRALRAGRYVVLAGGTDFYPARVGRPLSDDVLDISAIPALNGITRQGSTWRIGALTTWAELRDASLPSWFEGLKQAARTIGGEQVQNRATLCGNICNASPAADSVPNLLALDAVVELASLGGRRLVPIGSFILGNRRTARRPDELVTALLIAEPSRPARSRFLKLGARAYLVISIVMVAALLEATADGKVAAARVAVGACSAAAQRLFALERVLVGRPLDGRLGGAASAEHLEGLRPIDDIRATAAYRRDAALTLVRRLLGELGSQGA